MKQSQLIVQTALAALLAVGNASALAQDKPEKCFGVAKAGKNDCQTATSACAATAKQDSQKDAFVFLPKGSCERIVGGSLQPAKG